MEPITSVQSHPSDRGKASVRRGVRREVLVVEPDALTQWSLRMYLGRWFTVHSTNSAANALQVLLTHPVDILVVSDELPTAALATLEQHAHSFNAHVSVVRLVTDSGARQRCAPCLGCLEKPFELAALARLLGIPEDELPGD